MGDIARSIKEACADLCTGMEYRPAAVYDARRDGLPSVSIREQLEKKPLAKGTLVCVEMDLWPRPADKDMTHRSGLNACWVSTAILRSAEELDSIQCNVASVIFKYKVFTFWFSVVGAPSKLTHVPTPCYATVPAATV